MLSLMKRVLGPSTPYQDKIMYLNSLVLNMSMCSEKDAKSNTTTVIETVVHSISTSEDRHLGLQVLEMALQQNPQNFYVRPNWMLLIYDVIKDKKVGCLEKMQACKVLSLSVLHIPSDPSFDSVKEELCKDLFPFLLNKIEENVEWAEEAGICVKVILQNLPKCVTFYQKRVLQVILHQASICVSSKSFEVFAECFAELPNCSEDGIYKNDWNELYLMTLKTLESLLVASLNNEPYTLIGIDSKQLPFKDDEGETDFLPDFTKRVRRFLNLCKCLAKLLSIKSRYPVKAPVYPTLKFLIQLFSLCKKDNVSSQQEALLTYIAQMKLGGLTIIESLILNCRLLKYTSLMINIIRSAIESSYSACSSEKISELRVATWKVMSLWVDCYGASVCRDIINAEASNLQILEELRIDTSISDKESSQDGKSTQENSKSKKSINNNSPLKINNEVKVCIAALESLDCILSAGIRKMSKGAFEQICSHVFKICESIGLSRDLMPLPYNDESCREKLFTVVLTIIEHVKPEDHRTLQTAMKIIRYINQDPSYKVKKLINRASAKCRLQFYPNRQYSLLPETRRQRQTISIENIASLWASEEYSHDIIIQHTSAASETEDAKIKIEPPSENEVEVHSGEYENEPHSPELELENQYNGEEMEVQSSSQGQDDMDSDNEEENEEEVEEEEEERSFADEIINQEEIAQEIFIPANRKMQTPPPVQINLETVQSTAEREYEELAPCIKTEENFVNKDKCVNGERRVMLDENMPSSSTQKTNENGIFGTDNDDLDEENEEEGDEENESYPAEKRVDSYDHPPCKKQKVETDDTEGGEKRERAKSPTLEEMKADFLELLPSLEDVKSGKVQLSSP